MAYERGLSMVIHAVIFAIVCLCFYEDLLLNYHNQKVKIEVLHLVH